MKKEKWLYVHKLDDITSFGIAISRGCPDGEKLREAACLEEGGTLESFNVSGLCQVDLTGDRIPVEEFESEE